MEIRGNVTTVFPVVSNKICKQIKMIVFTISVRRLLGHPIVFFFSNMEYRISRTRGDCSMMALGVPK